MKKNILVVLTVVMFIFTTSISFATDNFTIPKINSDNSIDQIIDIDKDNNFYPIHYIVKHNIIQLKNNLFMPQSNISAQEFVSAISCILAEYENSQDYIDAFSFLNKNLKSLESNDKNEVDVKSYMLPYWLVKNKQYSGINKTLTRADVAELLYSYLENNSLLETTPLLINDVDENILNMPATINFFNSLLGIKCNDETPITKLKAADILANIIPITYDNYEYYRSQIKDTSNRNVLKCYSEGILSINSEGLFNPKKVLSKADAIKIISNLKNNKYPLRPEYEYIPSIPILMYHEINALPNKKLSGLYVSVEKFKEELDLLQANGYNTITMDQLYNHWEFNTPLPQNPVVLTFDDGYPSHYTVACLELANRGMCGTFYLVTSALDDSTVKSTSNIKRMFNEGMEIGSHTVTHHDVRYGSDEKVEYEIKTSKEFLENLLGIEINHFCYPVGHETSFALSCLDKYGYKTAVKTRYGISKKKNGFYKLRRIRVDYYDSPKTFLNKLK